MFFLDLCEQPPYIAIFWPAGGLASLTKGLILSKLGCPLNTGTVYRVRILDV